jgi:uncharacterized cupin superfamily protein
MPINVFWDEQDDVLDRPGYERRTDFWAAHRLGAELLGGSVYVIPPGQSSWPYHWHHGNEELVLVLAGTPTLRRPEGERELGRGDVVLFKRGPEGAHKLTNHGDEPARVLIFSSQHSPDLVTYPDSDKVLASSKFGRFRFKAEAGNEEYWEGEP